MGLIFVAWVIEPESRLVPPLVQATFFTHITKLSANFSRSPLFCFSSIFVSKIFLEEKKGVDRSSTVIARDVTEGRSIHPSILADF